MIFSPTAASDRRYRALLVILSFAFVAAIVPHALEDFSYGDFARRHVNLVVPEVLLPLSAILTICGAVLVLLGRASGGILLAIIGAIWALGAILIHGHDFLFAGPLYRHGFVSRLLEMLIVVFGISLVITGLRFSWHSRPEVSD